MFVKVIIDRKGKIIREDSKQIVGTRAFFIGYDFFNNDNELIKMHYGYFEGETFKELCELTTCSFECLSKGYPNCRYVTKVNNKTEGFYYEEN